MRPNSLLYQQQNEQIMKKTIMSILIIAFITAVISQSYGEKQEVNTLRLENIEALASGEGENVQCIGSGQTLCPKTGTFVAYTINPFNWE